MRWMFLLLGAAAAISLASLALAQSPTPTTNTTPTVSATASATRTAAATSSPSVTPTATATLPLPPLTAPPNVRLATEAILLDANNFPLPPERKKFTNILTWDPVAGALSYEVGRSDISRTDVLAPVIVATVHGGPPLRFEEPYPFLSVLQWCYQVRAVRGAVIGPWSNAVCTVRPPSSGPSRVLPPDTGSGMESPDSDNDNTLLTSGAVALGLSGLLVVVAAARYHRAARRQRSLKR